MTTGDTRVMYERSGRHPPPSLSVLKDTVPQSACYGGP